jgi:mono/diheme cytochrome c family protein
MRKIPALVSIVAAAGLAFLALTGANARGASAAPPAAASAIDPVKLYKAQCSTCHGLDGKGATTAGKKVGTKDWTDGKTLKALSDEQITKVLITGVKGDDGKQRMPSFAKLGPDKQTALTRYVRTLQK